MDILSTLLALCRVLLLVAITVSGIVAGLVWGAYFAIVNFGELAGVVAVAVLAFVCLVVASLWLRRKDSPEDA